MCQNFICKPCIIALSFLLYLSNALPAADSLQLLNGTKTQLTVISIDATGKIVASDSSKKYELMGLRGIRHSTQLPSRSKEAAAVFILTNGSEIVVNSLKYLVDDEEFQVDWKYSKQLKVSLDDVAGIKLLDQKLPDATAHQAALKTALAKRAKGANNDQLLIRVKQAVQSIEGLFVNMTAEQVVFKWMGKDRKFDRKKVYAVVTAKFEDSPTRIGRCNLRMKDGSSMTGLLKKLEKGQVELEYAKASSVSIPWEDVLSLRVFSDRMIFLSELKPTSASHRPALVSFKLPWQADRNVQGGPLTLGSRTYEKGIGVHSHSVLKFDVDSKFNQFAATIGLDSSLKGQGDCEFVVKGDGKELFRQRMKSSENAKEINVDLKGASSITLEVEFGEKLDFL